MGKSGKVRESKAYLNGWNLDESVAMEAVLKIHVTPRRGTVRSKESRKGHGYLSVFGLFLLLAVVLETHELRRSDKGLWCPFLDTLILP